MIVIVFRKERDIKRQIYDSTQTSIALNQIYNNDVVVREDK